MNEIMILEKYKEDFSNKVEQQFARANIEKGNEALDIWSVDFLQHIEAKYPDQELSFLGTALSKKIERGDGISSSLMFFQDKIGNQVRQFIDNLVLLESKGDYKMKNKSIDTDIKALCRNVFIISGRNKKINESMFSFLDSIGLNPIEFLEARKFTGKPSPTIQEILMAAFDNAQAAVVLMTPDEEGHLKKEFYNFDEPKDSSGPVGQPRLNVVFESGMAIATQRDRTVIVSFGSIRSFTDLDGIHFVRMNDSADMRLELVERLEDCGCLVNIKGKKRWLSTGDFNL